MSPSEQRMKQTKRTITFTYIVELPLLSKVLTTMLMKQILIITLVLIMTVTFALFFNTNANAWHENLGIDANKAAELYRTNPNDPAIVQWKNALQLAINNMDNCFYPGTAIG